MNVASVGITIPSADQAFSNRMAMKIIMFNFYELKRRSFCFKINDCPNFIVVYRGLLFELVTTTVASNENKLYVPDFGKADEPRRELCIAKQKGYVYLWAVRHDCIFSDTIIR